YSAVNATVSYKYVVTNTGNVTIGSVSGRHTNVDDTQVCYITTLAPGQSATCTAVHTVTQTDLDAGAVTNTATGHGVPAGGTLVEPTATSTEHATQNPALPSFPTRRSSDLYSAVNATVSYKYVVTNTGNVTI